MNNKGIVPAGILFAGGNLASSGFFSVCVIAVMLTMRPSVLDNFRYEKALGMCEETTALNCEDKIGSMSKTAILAYIKDDKMPITVNNLGYIYKADKATVLVSN